MLTGDLTEFSLREILQFLATTSSSGVLQLHSVESTAGIALRDGGVCVALLDINAVRGLAARMIRAGAVDVDGVRAVGGQHDGDAIAWAAALGHDVREADVAADLYLEHTYETLGWLTRHERATFSFERSARLDEWPFHAASVDDVLAIVEERAELWADLPDTVSDLTLVCSPLPDPPDSENILTIEQWRVIALVDGRRAVRDLIELSGIGHLQTCRQLHELVTAGLIELVEPGASSTLATLLDGLDVERGVSSITAEEPARQWTLAEAGTSVDLDAAVVAVPTTETGPDTAVPVAGAERSGAAAQGPDPEPADVGADETAHADAAPMDDEPESDANRTLLERLIGGKGAVR